MSKFIILECNRDRAIDINSTDELTDPFRNRWTNQVSSSGIVVNSGDVLTIDQSIVNVKGASTEVMEFTGKNNVNGICDNKAIVECAFYVNHTGKNSCNMPMINHRIFRGVGDLRALATNLGLTADGGNTYVAGDQRMAYTMDRFQNMIGDRSIGETFFLSFPFANNPNPAPNPIPPNFVADPYDSTIDYVNTLTMPNVNKLFRIKLTTRGGGIAGQANSGYVEGDTYTIVTDDATAIGSTMTFKVVSTVSLGTIPNVIENFEIEDFGDKDFSGQKADGTPSTITISVGAGLGTNQVYTILNALDDDYKSSDISRFDGRKYYPLAVDFTGLAFFEDAFVTRTDGVAPQPNDANYDVNNIQSQPLLRTKDVNLEIDTGFQTPENVANILTEQLGRPEQLNQRNNVGDFLDTTKIDYAHNDPLIDFSETDNPNIIASQVFQPASANFVNFGKGVPSKSSFCGRRTTFYQSIAWLEPERWVGLVPSFKQFSVANSPFSIANDIAISYGTRACDNDIYGDFTRQGVGEFGSHVVILNNPVKIGLNEVRMSRGTIIVSNIRFTRKNLNRLRLMKEAEKYMGDLSKPLDTSTQNFNDFLSVNLDVGIYDDEMSTQGPATTNDEDTHLNNINQRFKFATLDEAIADTFCLVHVDRGFNNALNGFQRDLENTANDGQQLSNVWVKSRYNDAYEYVDGGTNLNNDTIRFQDSFNDYNGGTNWNSANTDINQVFGAGYYDAVDNEFYTIADLNAIAKEMDLAVVPINVPVNPNDVTQNQGLFDNQYGDGEMPPFVGFISATTTSFEATSVFDPVKQFESTANQGNWCIDESNFKYGMMLGFDPSFTRNKAIAIQNNQVSNLGPQDRRNFLNYVNMGATSPSIRFDPAFSRFSISGLNTPEFIGNGLTTDDPLEFTPSDNPEQQVITFNRRHQVTPSQQKNKGTLNPASAGGSAIQILRVGQFGVAQQEPGTFIDSQSGVAITKMKLVNSNDTQIAILDPTNYFNKNDHLFHGTMFDKMGFKIDTLLPKYGGANAFFRDPTLFKDSETFASALINLSKPLSTGADVTSQTTQELSLNSGSAPLFDLGGDVLEKTIRPDAVQGEITATELPKKFEFSYLTINSSLVQEGTDTLYIGGSDNQSKLPCMTYLTRENNESDFFYQNERTFTFTATKDFTITDITTDIRLPDGTRPNLDPHSTIIYKIEKPLNSLNPQSNQVAQPVRQHERIKNQERNLEK